MADNEYWRQKTEERIQKRDRQQKCPHRHIQVAPEHQKWRCLDCEKLLSDREAHEQ